MKRAIVLLLWAVLSGAACRVSENRPVPVSPEDAMALSLAIDVPFEHLDIPHSLSSEGHTIPLGPWKTSSGKSNRTEFKTHLPIRPRVFFFSRPVKGMQVLGPDGLTIPHQREARKGETHWSWTAKSLRLSFKGDPLRPTDQDYTLIFDKAIEREERLHFDPHRSLTKEEFVRARFQLGSTTYSGLYLPAPAQARFSVTIPKSAELTLQAGILPPEIIREIQSDGATLTISILSNGKVSELKSHALLVGELEPIRLNLEAWADQTVELIFQTRSPNSTQLDFCFLADPIIASRQRKPKRIFLVFVDTLRPDHMALYGYHRDTTPFIDAWAKGGTTFTEARSVAPWTLPSYRTMVTGRYPNRWGQAETVQGILRKKGWATAMFAGNVYLSTNFEANLGWGTHYALLDANATHQVDKATDWLKQHTDQNVMMMLHLMDPHLPYQEPSAYRRLFAGSSPKSLSNRFARSSVLRASKLGADGRQYIQDRYDNNLRYVDDELKRFLSQRSPDDLVFFFSDHGEEFWEHGGFEHGHQFWDEIIRVPMIARGPGIKVQRVESHVTLLDLTPTILDYVGAQSPNVDGQSLWPLLSNKDGWREYPTGLGHPLYGGERWGVVTQNHKFFHHNGEEWLFDLEKDPKEHKNVMGSYALGQHAWHESTGNAFKQDFPAAIRLTNRGSKRHSGESLDIQVNVHGGIRHLWVGEDPLSASHAEILNQNGETTLKWAGGYRGSRDIYLVPNNPIPDVLGSLSLKGRIGTRSWETVALSEQHLHTSPKLANHQFEGGGQIRVSIGRSPVPSKGTQPMVGHDDEMQEMLKALGYVTGNEAVVPTP